MPVSAFSMLTIERLRPGGNLSSASAAFVLSMAPESAFIWSMRVARLARRAPEPSKAQGRAGRRCIVRDSVPPDLAHMEKGAGAMQLGIRTAAPTQ